jgi:hypothetical protein
LLQLDDCEPVRGKIEPKLFILNVLYLFSQIHSRPGVECGISAPSPLALDIAGPAVLLHLSILPHDGHIFCKILRGRRLLLADST